MLRNFCKCKSLLFSFDILLVIDVDPDLLILLYTRTVEFFTWSIPCRIADQFKIIMKLMMFAKIAWIFQDSGFGCCDIYENLFPRAAPFYPLLKVPWQYIWQSCHSESLPPSLWSAAISFVFLAHFFHSLTLHSSDVVGCLSSFAGSCCSLVEYAACIGAESKAAK